MIVPALVTKNAGAVFSTDAKILSEIIRGDLFPKGAKNEY